MADTMTLEQVRDRLQLYTDYRSTGGHEGKHLSPADLEACADAIDAAIKQREQDAKDAARHRWLRDTQTTFGVSAQYDTAGKPIFYVRLHGFGTSADDVDAAIDAAMAKESGR
jgi:hypothetical protein